MTKLKEEFYRDLDKIQKKHKKAIYKLKVTGVIIVCIWFIISAVLIYSIENHLI